MDKENFKRHAEDSKKKIFDKLETDYKELNKVTKSEELLEKIKKCEKSYEEEFDKLANFISRKGLIGMVLLDYTDKFVNKKLELFTKLRKKHNLLLKEEQQNYQNLNKSKGENSYQTVKKEAIEEQNEEKNVYSCAECFQDKTGIYWSRKEKNDNNKLCSKKCFQKYYGEICNSCVKECLSFYRDNDYQNIVYCSECWKKKRLEKTSDQEWNPTIYCRYCSAKTELFDVCDKQECLAKMNQDIENKNNNTNNIEKESNLIQQQQLLTEIMQLEQNPTKNQAELESKKKKLKDLETKKKQLDQQLPLTTQITILQKEIKQLTNKPTRTQTEEALLTSKKKQLEELLKKQNSSTGNAKPGNRTGLYVGLGIGGVLVLLFTIILLRKNSSNTNDGKRSRMIGN